MASNVIEFVDRNADWQPRTEMDFVYDRMGQTLENAQRAFEREEFEKAVPELLALIRDFRRAKRKGSRLTP